MNLCHTATSKDFKSIVSPFKKFKSTLLVSITFTLSCILFFAVSIVSPAVYNPTRTDLRPVVGSWEPQVLLFFEIHGFVLRFWKSFRKRTTVFRISSTGRPKLSVLFICSFLPGRSFAEFWSLASSEAPGVLAEISAIKVLRKCSQEIYLQMI